MCKNFLHSGLIFLLVLFMGAVSVNAQLAPEYRRNGECYLLIGEGPVHMRGVYRLNNPERERYYHPPIYLFRPLSSFGFAVDLERKIYTFSEEIAYGFKFLDTKLKRQVLDGVSAAHSDWGYHAHYHADHRGWDRGSAVYRVGPAGRTVTRYSSWVSNPPRSAGPGRRIAAPAGDPLPDFSSNSRLHLPVYGGRNWYEIPNGAWYSGWRTRPWQGRGYGSGPYFSTFYVVYGDREEGQPHYWKLYTYTPRDVAADNPNYRGSAGATVAVSYDKRITRQIFAGCLDGCGGASGSGSGVADPMINDLAFMPPIKDKPSRTYFYSRPVGKTNYEISLNNRPYSPPAANRVIGYPARTDSYWIGVSMRDVNSDYVYALGNSVIRDWYRQATGENPGTMAISAVAVSNQWNQEGGIVYAYDSNRQRIYKFDRKEKEGSPITRERYQLIPMREIIEEIAPAHPDSEIDDIQSDGFGSLYFALSYPAKDPNRYDPTRHFKLDDAMYLDTDWVVKMEEGVPMINGSLIFHQEYAKAVFERNIYDGKYRKVGQRNYAERYYNVAFNIHEDGMRELSLAGAMPHGRTSVILASWSAEIGDNNGVFDYRDFNRGSLGLFYEYNFGDPGRAKIAVINVPTPPRVISLGGKKSYLDIIGPYPDSIPFPDNTNRHTNQSQNLISPEPPFLKTEKLYFYMVENYPLPDGAQDPTSQPDWNNNGRQGGFITSMLNPESSARGGRVFYRWRTWMVQDLRENAVCKPIPAVAPPKYPVSSGMNPYTYFYSPVPAKYIMTCQVSYDWYDYDLLKFGDTIDDLPKVLRTDEKAVPVAAGSLAMESGRAQLNAIMNTPEFKFMLASSSLYISEILEGGDNYFAVKGIIASGTIASEPEILEVARIQRCDEGGGNNVNNNSHWFFGTTGRPLEHLTTNIEYHGIEAGNAYNWRVAVASQANVFFDISSTSDTRRNYIARKLQEDLGLDDDGNEINPYFVNRNPNFQFRNLGNDLKWMSGGKIHVTAHLRYRVPKDGGGFEIVNRYLLGEDQQGLELTPADFSVNKPIICQTPADLPPTDPFEADLVITMRRMFEYDMWFRVFDGSSYEWGNYFTLPKEMKLEAKTKVIIIDREKPILFYADTNPNNLFGETGQPLSTGVGPSGQGNPTNVSFTITDNNPWEAVDEVRGITSASQLASNITHNNNVIGKSAPTAQYNLRPVFAKGLSRSVRLQFTTGKREVDGTMSVGLAELDFEKDYRHFFYFSPGGVYSKNENRVSVVDQSFKHTLPTGHDLYFASIKFQMPLSAILLGPDRSNVVPVGYANNTPGYRDSSGNIKPYQFFVEARDSSGNRLDSTQLNMALHVRDVIPPNPYAVVTELKDNTTVYAPMRYRDLVRDADAQGKALTDMKQADYSPVNTDDTAYNNAFADTQSVWEADNTEDGFIKNMTGPVRYQTLKFLGNSIVTNFDDEHLVDQLRRGVPPGFVEDNVEVVFRTGVNDNAGIATATLTYSYRDLNGNEDSRDIAGSNWVSGSHGSNAVASSTLSARAVFRGRPDQFPMGAPIIVRATDNARDWDYYDGDGDLNDPNNPWSDWRWGTVIFGRDQGNTRTFRTTLPVYGTRFEIRTIDRGLRQR